MLYVESKGKIVTIYSSSDESEFAASQLSGQPSFPPNIPKRIPVNPSSVRDTRQSSSSSQVVTAPKRVVTYGDNNEEKGVDSLPNDSTPTPALDPSSLVVSVREQTSTSRDVRKRKVDNNDCGNHQQPRLGNFTKNNKTRPGTNKKPKSSFQHSNGARSLSRPKPQLKKKTVVIKKSGKISNVIFFVYALL